MADRRVKVVLEADAGRLVAGFRSAEQATRQFANSLDKHEAQWDNLSTSMIAGGAVVAAGLGYVAKAAMDWESAWAGVRKTVDGSPEQMAALEGQLRGLAQVLPSTHEEIAGVAEAAGQLGIQRENVAGFTRTMIDLGQSTNLSAEEAATSLARFANVMGTSQSQFSNLGSSIVGLGNNFATTEAEIVAMGMRLAGAGRQAKMTEGDVLGIATAMSSVGIEAEAGGTAMSRVITEMGKSVDMSSKKLDSFARVAGMSSDAFADLWKKNSGQAMTAFITGLGDMQKRGESLEPVLAELGMTDIRVGDALRRSASAADLFAEAMARGNKDFDANTALSIEAGQRYETTASQLAIARNNAKDAAIGFGSELAPALAGASKSASQFAQFVGAIPAPLKSATVNAGLMLAGIGLIGGAAIKASLGVVRLRASLDTLAASGTRSGAAMSTLGRAGGPIMAVVAAAAIAEPALDGLKSKIDELAGATPRDGSAIKDLIADGDVASIRQAIDATDGWAGSLSKLSGYVSRVGNMDKVLPTDGITRARRELEAADQVLAEMVASGNADQAAEVVSGIGASADQVAASLPQYSAAVRNAAADSKLDEAKDGAGNLDALGESAAGTSDAVTRLATALEGLGSTLLNERSATRAYQQALDDASAAVKKNGATLDVTTAKGRENANALDGIATAAQKSAAAIMKNGGSAEEVAGVLTRGRADFLRFAESMGMPKSQARELASALLDLPPEVDIAMKTSGLEEAKAGIGLISEVTKHTPEFAIGVSAPGIEPTTEKVGALSNRVDEAPKRLDVTASGRGVTETDRLFQSLEDQIRSTPNSKTVSTSAPGISRTTGLARTLGAVVLGIPGAVGINASMNAGGAISEAQRLRNVIASVPRYLTIAARITTLGSLPVGNRNADGGMWTKTAGGIVRAYAAGGFWDGTLGAAQPQIRAAGGLGVNWAEDGAGPWEAFISGHPGKRRRSRAIAADTVGRLGGQITWLTPYADGGIRESRHYVAPSPAPVSVVGAAPNVGVRVFIDGRDVRAVVREELDADRRTSDRLARRGR